MDTCSDSIVMMQCSFETMTTNIPKQNAPVPVVEVWDVMLKAQGSKSEPIGDFTEDSSSKKCKDHSAFDCVSVITTYSSIPDPRAFSVKARLQEEIVLHCESSVNLPLSVLLEKYCEALSARTNVTGIHRAVVGGGIPDTSQRSLLTPDTL
ncbi:hypothetical protein Q9233_015608 [Columba guinea]|nr:hypothetical protein Q9233_015608 [Columba guinea]